MFKPKGHHVRQSQVEKFTRYSIRKVSFGAASVAVATGLFFLGGGSVQAAEQLTNPEPTKVQNPQNVNDKSPEPSKEVSGQESATDKAADVQKTSSAKESATDTQASEVKNPNVEAEKVTINTASLEDLVAKAESRLSQLTEDKKTKSVIDDAKNLVNKAKELLKDDTKTQEKVDVLAKQLSSSLIILNSIKSDTTEEDKVNKNQDPRNGKEIPGKGESGFRADTYKLDDSNNAQLPDTATTGTDKFTFVALPKNDPRRNSGAIAIAGGGAGDIVVNGTGEAPTDLEIEMYSSQRTDQAENPKAMSTVNGQPATSPGRMDYPLSKEQVQKLQEEAKLWVGKEKPDGNRVTTNLGAVYGSSGAYEFLATEIYKLGYEQGVDRVYIPNISNRFGVSEKATQAGWKIKSIEPSNLPPGLIYDRESDSIQGRVVANLQNGVYDFRFDVAAENERTHKIVRMKFQNLRSGWIGWQDTQPPKIEVSNDAYEATVGQNVNIEVKYSDDAGSNFSGNKRRVKYTLKDGRVVEIGNQSYRQAVSGLAGHSTTKNQGPAETSIPGVTYDLSRDKTPTEKEANGDEKIFGKGILTGSPTKAGIYTVSVFAKDYNNRNKSDTTWIHSGHEVQKYMTVVVKPTATVKNVHAYATNIPVTISEGASSAELTLPNGKVIKLEAKNGNWTLADGGAVLGSVGGEINVPVSQEDTKDAAVDTIKVKAITENVKATLLRNGIELLGDDGQKHTARLSETTGHWELEDAYKEVRTPTAGGGYKLTKRQVYTEVQADGSTNYYIYSYTRTFNANDKVVSVDEVTRPKTVVPRLNTENTEGATTTVEYDAVTKEWKSSDGSNVTATKEGDFWKVRTDSGFTGLIKGSKAESVEDKGSILNDAPTATSTSYTAVKGATVDLVKQASAAVTKTDREDDSTTSPKKETTVTKVTVTSPSGQQSEYTDLEQAKAHLLSEVGTYTVKVEVKDSNGNVVTANTETGTDKGAETAVNSTTYTITVKDQETNKLYKVEDDTVTNDELKAKVNPTAVEGFTPTKNDITDIPTTAGKAGQTLPTPATVTYTKGTETISVATKVDVVVLPKVTPEGVKVLKDSTDLEEVVKAKATEAATATTKLPDGVTVRVKEVKAETVPATTATGVQTPATVVVEYVKDGNVVKTSEVPVPVTVVGSTPKSLVVFEGDTVEAKTVQDAVTPGTDGTKGNPVIPEDLTKTTGKKEVTVPVTYEGIEAPEQVKVPVTVLPVAKGEVTVPKGETADKVKEVAKAKAEEVANSADFKAKLPDGAKDVEVGAITEEVLAAITTEAGTNRGTVKVPVTYTVDSVKYTKDAEITVNVVGSEPKTVYTVEGTKPDAEKVKNAVTPGTGGTVNAPTETALPETTGKVGAKDVTVPTTVTYPNGTETVNVPVEVLPKATPEKVTTLKDTTSDNLTTAVKEKAQAALGKLTLPSGVTVELVPNQDYAVPATDSNGDKTAVPVKVQYKDATGTVVAEDTINVPVTVVSSTPSKIVVFEGEKPTADQAKAAVTPGTDGTKGEPTTLPETAGKAGATDVKVDVPVTYDNGKLTETVSVPVTVLPKPEADEILVAKNSDKEKAKEKVLAQAEKAIADGTFTGKLPQGATVTVDNTVPVTIPDLTDDTEVEVTVKYTVPGQDKPLTTTVKVPVTVVEGVPQIVPVDESNKQPDPEKNIDKTDYPEGSTFRYKTPDGQTSPIDVTTTGDKNVVVEVLDPQGNTIVEVPATVRVVGSTPQFVVADPSKPQPEAKDSVTPGEYPDGTTFEYKTPVDTTTAGEKDVTVVAKLNGQPITEVPAKVVVVDPKTQYVVADPSKPQPDASKSIDPEQYPDGTTFEYKTPVDTTTPGEKDVVVVAKDGEDKLVEVPTKVKVVQGNPQIVPVDEGKKQPSPEDSIDPNDYPDDATFEYKEEVDTSTPGDKKVTVVVKQGDKVLVEVPSTVRVVESYPKYVPVDPAKKQPDPKENINPNDFPTGTTFEYKDNTPVDTTTPGEKDVTVVAKLNGQPITEIPAKIVVVEPKTQYVPVNAEGDKKPKPQDSITPDDYPEDSTFEYKTPEGQTTPYDGTTPGEKDVTVVVKDPDGDTIVEVPAKIKVVQGKEQLTPVNAEDKDKPKAEDSITPSDYPEGSTFEYKVPEGQTTPYDGSTPGDKPVTVVVKDKDGKVLVEVPATIKVVETKPTPIETPVTNTPLTEGDYTKGMKIPEGATVKVGDLPDLTTPGEKNPVKVTITLPNGKSYTVDVPVTVTPVKEIETPVTTEKLTPENVLKQIKVPEGATTKVGDLPDLTTPGKKDPVKVTITLPNGKVVTVDVPVTVTPVKEIETPVTTAKLTPEDILKQIKVPEGATTEVGDLPDLTTPGKKDPVKVTVTLPNGKVITVEVPVNVTPIKEIETPVTTAKLTPEDILKQIKVPEGARTKVGDLPDLTTPGKKDPVKVTITLPNGKVVTVDVPVTVTPVKEIETPVTKDKLTPEDILKQIKVPEGATSKVENIPDLTTPGKKDPVKVTITLPNGKVVTVEIPVNVTPIEDIVKKQGDPITAEDVEKHIPKGVKVINIGDKPTTYIPGERPSIPVVIELPNGIRVTMNIPVIVTPKVTPVVVPVGTPVTPEDVQKHIELPNGWKVTKIGEIPTTTTPGTKPVVPVEIELPDGRKITVDVPVIVTPTVRQIVVPQGTPITPDDVKGHIDLPKEPGWEIIEVGEIPTTIPAGVKPSVKVKIKVPTGEIVEVGEIPTTETPGTKPVVKVKVKLPDGRIITVEVPVKVTPKSNHGDSQGNNQGNNGSSTTHIVTRYQDGDGKEISPEENGSHGPKTLEGFEYTGTKTDKNGNVIHNYKKVVTPTRSEQPVSPVRPTDPDKPVVNPTQVSRTESNQAVSATTVENDKKELPNTGTDDKNILSSLGLLGMLGAFGLVARKKKED